MDEFWELKSKLHWIKVYRRKDVLNLLTGCLSSSGECLFLQFYCSEWDFCKVRKQQKRLIIRLVFGVHSFMRQVKNGSLIKGLAWKTPRWKVALTTNIFNQQLHSIFRSKYSIEQTRISSWAFKTKICMRFWSVRVIRSFSILSSKFVNWFRIRLSKI